MKTRDEIKSEIQEKLQEAKQLKEQDISAAIGILEKIEQELLPRFNINKGGKFSDKNTVQDDKNMEISYLGMLGYMLYEIEDYEKSLQCYEGIEKKLPDDNHKVKVHKAQGDCLRKLARHNEALEQYHKGLDEKLFDFDNSAGTSDKAALFNSCGLIHMAREDHAKALDRFKKAIKYAKKNPLYYCNKGVALNKLGEDEEALKAFERAKELIDDGNIIGLTDSNISYITNTLELIIKNEDNVLQTQKTISRLDSNAPETQEIIKLFEGYKDVVNTVTAMAASSLDKSEVNTKSQEQLELRMERLSTQVSDLIKKLEECIRTLSTSLEVGTAMQSNLQGLSDTVEYLKRENIDIKEHLAQVDLQLSQTLKDYDVVLENYLESSQLSKGNKIKVKEYYNAFVGTILSAYTAAQAVNSNWVETKKSLVVSLLSGAISTIPTGGAASAKAVELIEAPLSAAISGIASLVGKSVEAGGNFAISRSIKQEARKAGKLASSPIGMNKQVSEEALEIVKNKYKQKQILDVTMEDLKKLPDALLKKIKKCLYEIPKEKVDEYFYGKMYSTAAERLGNKDAHALLKEYFKSASDGDHETMFKASAKLIREDYAIRPICSPEDITEIGLLVENVVVIEDIITKLCKRSVKGEWITHKGPFAHKSCSKLFEKEYLQSKLKGQNQNETPDETIEMVQMLMFKHMHKAIENSNKKDTTCVTGFSKKYPDLLKKINNEHPEYFVNEQVQAALSINIASQKIADTMVSETSPITAPLATSENDDVSTSGNIMDYNS